MDIDGLITEHLLRSSPDALVVVDLEGRIRFANDTVSDLFGYTPEALMGQPLDVLVPEPMRSRHRGHVAGFRRSPRNREMGAQITDLAARRADGTEFPAGIRLAPFDLGGQSFVAAAIRDMTEGRRINEALVVAREEADRANRAKSRFLATASHDLRQPLQAVHLLNAAMRRLVKDDDLAMLLGRQDRAIDNMIRLLNSLLDINRLESGAIEPRWASVKLADVLDELRNQFEPIARGRSIALHFPTADLVLRTDRTLILQLLENLIGNAVKYTDSGSITVRCAVDGDGVVLTVADTGIGIPPDKLARIFDEYYQVDASGERRAGVGLGLAIVREVARLLHYSVTIDSEQGRGTTARVAIPRSAVVTDDVEVAERGEAVNTTGPHARPRLLLVEDDEDVRRATELFLKLEGFEVATAATAAEARALVTRARGDELLIADYHLDGEHTGLDVLRALRRHCGRDVPAIVMSGDLPAVMRNVPGGVPLCRFLGKPVDTTALLNTLDELQDEAAGRAPQAR